MTARIIRARSKALRACRIEINYPGSGNNSQFSFDGIGRNTKIVENTGGSPTSTKQFVWCEDRRCEERDGSGALSKQFFKRGQRNSSINYLYSLDHLGSVREMTDSSGTIQSQYSFDLFGRVLLLQSAQSADFQYAGYYCHQPSKLSLTLTRAYASSFGRFISRDSIAERGGINLFAYVANQPLRYRDPQGTMYIGPLRTPPGGTNGDASYQSLYQAAKNDGDDAKKCACAYAKCILKHSKVSRYPELYCFDEFWNCLLDSDDFPKVWNDAQRRDRELELLHAFLASQGITPTDERLFWVDQEGNPFTFGEPPVGESDDEED